MKSQEHTKQEELKTAIETQMEEIEQHREELETWAGHKLETQNDLMIAWVGSGLAETFREDLERSFQDEKNEWYAGERVGKKPSLKDDWEQYRDHGGSLNHHHKLNSRHD
ncbi:MAG: hypothetical protein WCX70_00885 [Candidatus Paceibacterota bacterium]|jgi:hypothetical protein